jgi:hypothetical protein
MCREYFMFQSQKCLTLAEFWAFDAVHTFQARAAGSELYIGGQLPEM